MTVEEARSGREPCLAVGQYLHDGQVRFLPFSSAELYRARISMQRRLASFHFRTAHGLLVTSLVSEAAQFLPLERAAMDYGLVVCSADGSFYDAGRVESIIRRFSIAAVAGVSLQVLQGLKHFGHEPAKLFAGLVVWARPDAYPLLKEMPAVQARLWMEIGPALAVECCIGDGAHLDRLEWDVELEGETVVLSSRLQRSLEFHQLRTGIHAQVRREACMCGSNDPRIVLTAAQSQS
jgi:hypothetical protein